jgi:RecA-family ATPase
VPAIERCDTGVGIEPLIAQGERSVIYGEYGSLKSWILLDMAMHMAAGKDWLGHFKISKPRKVLYIDEEMAKDRYGLSRNPSSFMVAGAGFEPATFGL